MGQFHGASKGRQHELVSTLKTWTRLSNNHITLHLPSMMSHPGLAGVCYVSVMDAGQATRLQSSQSRRLCLKLGGKCVQDEFLSLQESMLQASREQGVKLNPEKSTTCSAVGSYFGHCITKDGVKPDPAKVAARETWRNNPWPVNYWSRFTPCSLTWRPESSECIWDAQHDKVLQKESTNHSRAESCPELKLQVDTSKYGPGAHQLRITITDSEINCIIEKGTICCLSAVISTSRSLAITACGSQATWVHHAQTVCSRASKTTADDGTTAEIWLHYHPQSRRGHSCCGYSVQEVAIWAGQQPQRSHWHAVCTV